MLTGPALGAAIDAARLKKNVSKKTLAEAFGVTPPSVQEWVTKGTIAKDKLEPLWAYFADVVGPEHWGLDTTATASPTALSALQEWRSSASPKSRVVIDKLTLLAKKNMLRDQDWQLIDDMVQRLATPASARAD